MQALYDALEQVRTADQLVAGATAALAAVGAGTPRLDAEVLLATALSVERSVLYARGDEMVQPRYAATFAAMLRRRVAREPLQYIVGRQEFWSLDFIVTPDVLIPRPETELLVELAVSALGNLDEASSRFFLPKQNVDERHTGMLRRSPGNEFPGSVAPTRLKPTATVGLRVPRRGPFSDSAREFIPGRWAGGDLAAPSVKQSTLQEGGRAEGNVTLCDLGTGSGCIAVALARELPRAEIWALDVSSAALTVAQANAQRHAAAERIHFVESDLFGSAAALRFDAIICNPPYVPSAELNRLQPELAWEPRAALDGGSAGLDIIRDVVADAPKHLVDGGWLIMELGAEHASAAEALARAAGFGAASVRPDYAGLPRVLLAQR